MILGVTSYVPIPGFHRTPEQYEALSEKLFATGIPLLRLDGALEQCWLSQYLLQHYKPHELTHSVGDNPTKNTIAYHCVQAQKSELLAFASLTNLAPDVLVWIDLGIFQFPGMTNKIVQDFMYRAQNEQAIAIPGCWERDYKYDDQWPCWRFCGGVIVMPRQYALVFDAAMKDEYKRHLRQTHNLSWEVNTMARVEERYPDLPIWWYRADHDESIFTNYQSTEHADGYQTQSLRGLEERYC